MPIREINAVEYDEIVYINYTMKETYNLRANDVLVVEVKRHFNSMKKLLNEINEKTEVKITDPRWIDLYNEMPEIAEKYNIKENDYIEMVFSCVKRGGKTEEIFPGEIKEYLDFDPDEE